jgi:hypothetical protein
MDNMISQRLASLCEGLNIHHHSDWVVFSERLKTAIHLGRARRFQRLWQIYAPSEEWYVDTVNGDVFVYLRPDDRVFPEWSPVNIFEGKPENTPDGKSIDINGLKAIPTGILDRSSGEALRIMLDILAEKHLIEALTPQNPRANSSEPVMVSTFREVATGAVYEFVEHLQTHKYSWHLVS